MKRTFLILVVSLVLILSSVSYGTPFFMGLGDLPGGAIFSQAYGVSADGSVAVGVSNRAPNTISEREGFRWTQSTGMMGLGLLSGGFDTEALGVSGDGLVIVGNGNFSTGRRQATRWTDGTGQVALGVLPGTHDSYATGTSFDGSVVVGYSRNVTFGTDLAFRWTQAGGMSDLGVLPGLSGSTASAVSAAGSVVVGNSGGIAFRWTQAEGMTDLGTLPGGPLFPSNAADISDDGLVIVGQARNDVGQNRAIRWTQATGMVDLGALDITHSNVRATAVSGDGSIAVGSSDNVPFIWDAGNGMRSLTTVLTDFGLGANIAGWQLTNVTGLSADGLTIVGYGVNPEGETEGWVTFIPEPSTLPMAGVAAALFTRMRRRQIRWAAIRNRSSAPS